ncbi:MAG: PSD1 and planctomycete cytochrome C domain-containing protein [Verrucomicrobiaceae bacterium]
MPRLVLLTLLILASRLGAAGTISYNRDIRPILSENCFFCHGFDQEKREADLRLDTFEGATKDRAIVPGHANQSELIARIHSRDAGDLMPPHDSVYALTDEQKSLLTQWINQGAQYEEHWAYKKLTRPNTPNLAPHPVDAFLQRKWNREKVTPVQKADPRTLLRRLSYDLRGLPPTPAEVAAFTKDPSQEHYQQFVDRYLNSLEFAEHQGLLWLDLVRHADSNGMVSDEPIASGPFRKYVIESFRDNTPFDQFTREQIAGDLLPDRNDRTLTASAYNRLVKTNCEAGVIEKEALYALKGEHVRAIGTVWLGATTGCAECHDHKYDPISAKDYYSLAAFFDPLIEAGVYEPGDRRVPLHYLHSNPVATQMEHQLAAQIDEVREKLYSTPIDPAALTTWSRELLAAETFAKQTKGSVDWPWFPPTLGPAHLTSGTFTQVETGRQVIAPPDTITRHLSGETLISPVQGPNEAFFTHLTLAPENPPEFVALQIINGAYRRVGWHQSYHLTYYWGPKDHPLLKESHPWLDPKKIKHMGPLPETGKLTRLEIPKSSFLNAPYTPQVMAWMQAGGKVTWGGSGYRTSVHQFFLNEQAESAYRYFWELPYNRDDRQHFHNLLLTSLKKKPADRRPIHTQLIGIAFREAQNPQLAAHLTELYRQAYLHRQSATPTLVSKEAEAKKTHVLKRGNFMDESGPLARPELPEYFANPQPGKNLTRLDLANWLVSRDNPMTPRVFVNRLWHQFYGRGISETLEDAGNQGDWPSHPDLLDWLACEFRRDWDIKKTIRLLVSADAYQLSSVPGSLLAQNDPTNRLHARQGRFRHSAEEIRDSALAAAGLLQLTITIPTQSFFPYQPDPYWQKSNKVMFGSRYQIWDTNPGKAQYQRSLYTFWKRQNIHPAMLALDAPTRQECTAKRPITNTPAQALALLNDPQFTEAARLLAARLITHPSPIDHLYLLTLQRPPSPEEKTEVRSLYEKMLTRFTKHPTEATALLTIGQQPPPKENHPQQAAWTAVSRVILNLHEFLTRS